MSNKAKSKWTIAIRPSEGERLRKITKIIGLGGGGFSVLAPYHSARSGVVLKHAVEPEMHRKAGSTVIKWLQCSAFTAEDRVKLTYHPDGFVQFSGENPQKIMSGRDPQSGEPKGMGIMARPFSSPSQSGPSVGVSAWGLDDFEPADETETLITFEPQDFYYRLDRPGDTNTWHISIYVFPTKAVPPVRFEDGQSVMDFTLSFPGIAGVSGTMVRLKTIRLQMDEVILGMYVETLAIKQPSKSGWTIGGPGNWNVYQTGYVIRAVYPHELIPIEGRPALDYQPLKKPDLESCE